MQIFGTHKSFYKLSRCIRTEEIDSQFQEYVDQIKKWERLKRENTTDATISKTLGVSRSTYYRRKRVISDRRRGRSLPSKRPKKLNSVRWGEKEKQLVLQIRRENSTYGKSKIATILKRDHNFTMSESTVGRILAFLKKKGILVKSRSAVRVKRKRNFSKGHATAWSYKLYKNMQIGERIQIDHMTVTKNGISIKHFQAWDRRSKFMHAQVYSHAKSSSAKRFLLEYLDRVPFKVLSIQVDGGSEFMLEFEDACAELQLELMVLPPSKPEYNGGVERGNRIFREEFYDKHDLLADSVGAMRAELRDAVHKYNDYRPHFALDGLTPNQYINQQLEAA